MKTANCLSLLIASVLVIAPSAQQPASIWPTSGWARATPESQGVSAVRLTSL